MEPQFNIIEWDSTDVVPIKAWNRGVQFEEAGLKQLHNLASMPFVRPYVAAMPDMHWGNGATVGSVIPSVGAIMPAAVGVDIGCGMIAVRTKMCLPEILGKRQRDTYETIFKAIPTGRTNDGGAGDRGAWYNVPENIHNAYVDQIEADPRFKTFKEHPSALSPNREAQLGTLGTGNHFIEVCVDNRADGGNIWIVIHSGSRGFGNKIGTYFTQIAKNKCHDTALPDPELAYLSEGTQEFDDYIALLHLAQRYAWLNRTLMMRRVIQQLGTELAENDLTFPPLIHCHHNYMAVEEHFGQQVILTRKGAVRACSYDWVIIPGSMGARTYIGRGLGSEHSFNSCSHGAGRSMSRGQARKTISLEQHATATQGIECHKGAEVIDESPSAYKDIESVMAAQTDLVEPVVALRQLVCVKGLGDSKSWKEKRRERKHAANTYVHEAR